MYKHERGEERRGEARGPAPHTNDLHVVDISRHALALKLLNLPAGTGHENTARMQETLARD
jgi:hypothetical protein